MSKEESRIIMIQIRNPLTTTAMTGLMTEMAIMCLPSLNNREGPAALIKVDQGPKENLRLQLMRMTGRQAENLGRRKNQGKCSQLSRQAPSNLMREGTAELLLASRGPKMPQILSGAPASPAVGGIFAREPRHFKRFENSKAPSIF